MVPMTVLVDAQTIERCIDALMKLEPTLTPTLAHQMVLLVLEAALEPQKW